MVTFIKIRVKKLISEDSFEAENSTDSDFKGIDIEVRIFLC